MSLLCWHCIQDGLPERDIKYAVTVIDGQALCLVHLNLFRPSIFTP